MNEEELIRDILNGNTKGYAQIVETYQQMVANLCYKLCGNRLDIDEVTQEVFVALYTALPRFKFQSKLSTFIYRITVNTVGRLMVHEKRMVPQSDNDYFRDIHDNETAERGMLRDERRNILRSCIGRLKYEQRTALVLYSFEEHSYKEIAEIMQVSLAKVETLIFRAKKNLRAMMTDVYGK